ncbi:MAG TPA: hypothetical protein VKX41_19165 [Alloacidobacterium sp.]|nr:hypothetical protein [Alloacidobacterium sp.]
MTDSLKSGAQFLLRPTSGVPLSLQQIEEHSRKIDDGRFAIEYRITSHEYRDSAGRLRQESETRDQAGHLVASAVAITDPVAGAQTILLDAEKVAYRLKVKLSPDPRLFLTDAADGQDSPHKWKVIHTEIEDRKIEGYVFKGTRIETSAEDVAGLTTTIDRWYSDQLKLFGAIDRKGPFQAYTIRIQQLQFREPDHALFEIPVDYQVVDVEMPQP